MCSDSGSDRRRRCPCNRAWCSGSSDCACPPPAASGSSPARSQPRPAHAEARSARTAEEISDGNAATLRGIVRSIPLLLDTASGATASTTCSSSRTALIASDQRCLLNFEPRHSPRATSGARLPITSSGCVRNHALASAVPAADCPCREWTGLLAACGRGLLHRVGVRLSVRASVRFVRFVRRIVRLRQDGRGRTVLVFTMPHAKRAASPGLAPRRTAVSRIASYSTVCFTRAHWRSSQSPDASRFEEQGRHALASDLCPVGMKMPIMMLTMMAACVASGSTLNVAARRLPRG